MGWSSDHQNDMASDSGVASPTGSVSWVVTRPPQKAWSGFPSSPSDAVPWMAEVPKEKVLGPRSNPDGSVASMIVAPPNLPGPSSNPEGPAVSWLVEPPKLPSHLLNPEDPAMSWLVEPSKLPGLTSNPEGPSVSWAVVNPPKLPSPPLTPSGPTRPWQVTAPSKKQSSLLNPEGLPLSWVSPKFQSSNSKGSSSWVVKPPKLSGTPSSTDPSVSWAVNTREVPEAPANPEGPSVSWLDALSRKPSFPMLSEGPAPWVTSEITDPSGTEEIGTEPTDESLAEPQLGHEVDLSFQSAVPQMEGGSEHNDPEMETEGVDAVMPYAPMFQGGTLKNSEAVYEQGNSEKMTDYVDSMSPYAFGSMQSSFSPYIKPRLPNLFYLFVTGQLPHGTVSHMQSEFEVGRDRTTQVGYEQFVFPGNSQKSSQTLVPPEQQQLLQEFQS